MISFDKVLWHNLSVMRIAPARAALDFEARLGKEQGWNAAFTRAVMEEYRRFLYLAATAEGAVTPSKLVDIVWHLHLTYTRHYWEELCGRILPRPLHHEPSGGGADEEAHFAAQYRDTLRRYRTAFGVDAPAEIWPDPDDAPARVSRGAALGAVGAATMVLAACSSTTVSASHWLPIVLLIGVFAGMIVILTLGRHGGGRKDDRSCGGGCGAGCGGGGSSCGGGCGGD